MLGRLDDRFSEAWNNGLRHCTQSSLDVRFEDNFKISNLIALLASERQKTGSTPRYTQTSNFITLPKRSLSVTRYKGFFYVVPVQGYYPKATTSRHLRQAQLITTRLSRSQVKASCHLRLVSTYYPRPSLLPLVSDDCRPSLETGPSECRSIETSVLFETVWLEYCPGIVLCRFPILNSLGPAQYTKIAYSAQYFLYLKLSTLSVFC